MTSVLEDNGIFNDSTHCAIFARFFIAPFVHSVLRVNGLAIHISNIFGSFQSHVQGLVFRLEHTQEKVGVEDAGGCCGVVDYHCGVYIKNKERRKNQWNTQNQLLLRRTIGVGHMQRVAQVKTVVHGIVAGLA
jgi:hypothetical protein